MIGGLDVSGRSTDRDRSEGKVLGLVERFSKLRRSGGMSGHGERLTGVYPDTIEFQRAYLTGAGGYYSAHCFVAGVIGTWLSWTFVLVPVPWERGLLDNAVIAFAFLGSWMFFAFFAYLELFAPADSPIYFDRKHRKVYKVLQSGARRWGFFGPRKSRLVAYDWDLVDAEHQTTLQASTASARRLHHLVFLVRKSEDDPTIVDHFIFADVDFVPALWEYISRYMEEGSAPLVEGEFPPVSNMGAYVPWSDFGAVVPFLDQPAQALEGATLEDALQVHRHACHRAAVRELAVLQPLDRLDLAEGRMAKRDQARYRPAGQRTRPAQRRPSPSAAGSAA